MRAAAVLRWGVLTATVVAVLATATLYSFNHFRPLEPPLPSDCTPVRGIAGAEDLQVDPRRRRVFISSHNRRVGGARGGVYAVSIDDPLDAAAWRDRTGGEPADFEPLGLSYFEEGDTRRLFVVNAKSKAVEIFAVDEFGDLDHLATVRDPRLRSPNNVAAVGPDAFYVTNDTDAGRSSLLGRLHFLLRAATGQVFFYNGVSWRIAAGGVRFANGVALSDDGLTLYVGETSGMALRAYDRDPQTDQIKLRSTLPLPGGVENLNVSGTGDLLIAAYPKPLAVKAHKRAKSIRAPSLILRYRDRPDAPASLEPVFRNDGDVLSAATSADIIGTKMVVGALAEDRFLICSTLPTAAY